MRRPQIVRDALEGVALPHRHTFVVPDLLSLFINFFNGSGMGGGLIPRDSRIARMRRFDYIIFFQIIGLAIATAALFTPAVPVLSPAEGSNNITLDAYFDFSFLSRIDFSINRSISATSLCRLCAFQVVKDSDVPNSSERDVIITLAVSRLLNIHAFIRTLRTTGSKARCVLFTDPPAMHLYSPGFFVPLENCGVQLILLPDLKNRFSTDVLRQFVYWQFLEVNRDSIDRVIVFDLFDTIVQKDPFIEAFQADRMYYSDEGFLIGTDETNREWIDQFTYLIPKLFPGVFITRSKLEQIYSHQIINSGLIAGGIVPFLRHLKIMQKIAEPRTMQAYGMDQGFLNLVVYGGLIDFPYEVDPPTKTFLGTMGILLSQRDDSLGRQLGSLQRFGRVFNLLHQVDRSSLVQGSILRACPNPESFPDFIRT